MILQEVVTDLYNALALAKSMIYSGETMSEQAEQIIEDALNNGKAKLFTKNLASTLTELNKEYIGDNTEIEYFIDWLLSLDYRPIR